MRNTIKILSFIMVGLNFNSANVYATTYPSPEEIKAAPQNNSMAILEDAIRNNKKLQINKIEELLHNLTAAQKSTIMSLVSQKKQNNIKMGAYANCWNSAFSSCMQNGTGESQADACSIYSTFYCI